MIFNIYYTKLLSNTDLIRRITSSLDKMINKTLFHAHRGITSEKEAIRATSVTFTKNRFNLF